MANSHIMTGAQFVYFRHRSFDKIGRHMKDIIADTNIEEDKNKSFLLLCSDYSAAFDIVSREYIYNVLRLIFQKEQLI